MRSSRTRRSYAEDPALCERVFALIELAFPGVSARHALARRIGGAWTECSTPFVIESRGHVIAHAGVLEAPLWVLGREQRIGCIHAVATHPDHRRRGHFHALMDEALAYCDARWSTVALTTATPRLYQAFGFRVLEEHWFERVLAPARTHAGAKLARLDLSMRRDVARLHRLLELRTPVSNVVGALPEVPIFVFDECDPPPVDLPELDVALALEIVGTELHLFDVIGARIPSIDEILARLPAAIERVRCHFAPDRLDAHFEPVRHALDGTSAIDTYFMVRGPFAAEGRRFMVPRSIRT